MALGGDWRSVVTGGRGAACPGRRRPAGDQRARPDPDRIPGTGSSRRAAPAAANSSPSWRPAARLLARRAGRQATY